MTVAINGNIYLIGFSGSGKSTVGPRLAKHLRCGFVDLDSEIERTARSTVTDIFAGAGEREFRRLETEALSSVAAMRTRPAIVALGGGAFQSRKNREVIAKSGIVVYLRCSVREIYRRLRKAGDRPLLSIRPDNDQTPRQAALSRIRELHGKRKETYEKADIIYSTTDKEVGRIVNELTKRLKDFKWPEPG